MALVLLAFVIQALMGASLLATWWRRGRRDAPTVTVHWVAAVLGLVLWIAFVATDSLVAAWGSFAAITVGNTYGDKMLLARVHHQTGTTSKRRNYPVVVVSIFRGRMPWRVAFHALFAGVVYFGCLGVCVASTVRAS